MIIFNRLWHSWIHAHCPFGTFATVKGTHDDVFVVICTHCDKRINLRCNHYRTQLVRRWLR